MSDDHVFSRIINSQFTRIFIVTFLILLLQIPIVFLQSLINDRQSNLSFAATNITASWGQPQTLVGPQINIPYIIETGSGEEIKQIRKLATFLPETLTIQGDLATEIRYRGLFEIPVYQADLTLLGEFQRPDFTTWTVAEDNILWDEAELTLEIADTRAIQSQTELFWNDEPLSFEPGLGKLGGDAPGIHVPLRGQMEGEQFAFQMPLKLKGSQKITFAPFGKLTQVELTSDWLDPSFQGPWLPATRSVNDEGFQAAWAIPSLGRSYPQQWNEDKALSYDLLQGSLFGVDLLAPVDNYRMVERSIKYNFIFLVLTFAVFWLFEVISPVRVHPLQYLLVGTAMSLFYLLQLALSEHIGFQGAYLMASGAVVVMITSYSVAVLRANRRGGIIGLTQIALYGYLYIVLAHQDYALLIGSLGLFIFLAIVMFLTRKVDWFNPKSSETR